MNYTRIITIVALVLAVVAGYFTWQLGQRQSEKTFVPALKYKIEPGTLITADMLMPSGIPLEVKAVADMPVITDNEMLVGKIAFTHILPGVPVFSAQVVNENESIWPESKNNYFITIDFSEFGVNHPPFNFMRGLINVCVTISQEKVMENFPSLPAAVFKAMTLNDSFCPIRNMPAVALTSDNMMPYTYIRYDPNAQKYVTSPAAVKFGIWLPDISQVQVLQRVAHELKIGAKLGYYYPYFVLPPAEQSDTTFVIEYEKQFDPYEMFKIKWNENVEINEELFRELFGENLLYSDQKTPSENVLMP